MPRKIAGWRAKIDDGEPADDALRTEASGLCGSLATVADEANTEAAQLKHAFLEASHSTDDTIEPPSDDALEIEAGHSGDAGPPVLIFGGDPRS